MQLVHLLLEVSSLTGASSFRWSLGVLSRHLASHEHITRALIVLIILHSFVRVQSCPTSFGPSLAPSAPLDDGHFRAASVLVLLPQTSLASGHAARQQNSAVACQKNIVTE